MTAPKPPPSARPKESPITKYFVIVLLVFGALQLYLNLQYETENHHQAAHIEGFKAKHLVKSSSAARKAYPDEGQEFENFEDEDAAEKKAAEEEQHADSKAEEFDKQGHEIAGLNCDTFGGPENELAQEMVYWEDIPSDNTYLSPFTNQGEKQYLTFEADHGGWNNIRMGMESVMTLAVAMGRTLVLPPAQAMYLLNKNENGQNKDWSFAHFFHMESIAEEHIGFEVITMEEFLKREGMEGNLKDTSTGEVVKPPKDRVAYDGATHQDIVQILEKYLTRVGMVPSWDPEDCLAAFPTTSDPKDVTALQNIYDEIMAEGGFPGFDKYVDKPYPVDAPAKDRMMENWAGRRKLCIYNETLQKQKLLHFSEGADEGVGARLLVHFYAFLFFEDWRHDLWMKRFVRDHVRYIDEIQCAAARIVSALRERSQKRGGGGDYNAFHIRRGDFQYKVTRYDAPKIIENAESELTLNGTIYIATDEKNRSFFEPFREKYDIVFLDDFMHLLKDVNTNYFGMIDSLIASRSQVFFGCWFSTFTGYINRIRGYHANKRKGQGYEMGYHRSYYYALDDRKFHLQQYYPVKKSFYAREFPASWRQIDKGIGELKHLAINN